MDKFKNLSEVVQVIYDAVTRNANIAVYGDYDVDGLMALMTFKETFEILEHGNVFLYPYYKRTHEIDFNFLNFCLSRKAELVIICDTGSNNMELLSRFCAYGMTCVVLDHHTTPYSYEEFPEDCFVVNTYLDRVRYGIENEMCGGAIAFMVCSELLRNMKVEYDIGCLGAYALLAQYADAIPMDTEFGRYLYELVKNRSSTPQSIDYFMESYSALTRRFAEYTFAPKINAVFRREQFSLINGLFLEPTSEVFLLVKQIKELHGSTISIVDHIVKVLRYEDHNGIVVANLTPLLNTNLPNNFILNHKGRIANAVANMEGKPCICVCDSGKQIEGSFRDLQSRDFLKYFAPLFKAGGHPPAFAFSISYTDWPYFINTVKTVGGMIKGDGQGRANPEYDMTQWFDLDMLEEIAYENEFSSPRTPATYIKVYLNKIVESTRYGLAYLLYSDGADSIWFNSERKIPYPQPVLLYPYLQKSAKVKAIWR